MGFWDQSDDSVDVREQMERLSQERHTLTPHQAVLFVVARIGLPLVGGPLQFAALFAGLFALVALSELGIDQAFYAPAFVITGTVLFLVVTLGVPALKATLARRLIAALTPPRSVGSTDSPLLVPAALASEIAPRPSQRGEG